MRHRRRGRTLGRSPKHQRALLRNLACALILTERDAELDDNKPKHKGRIITTLAKAKEVRPLLERCITIARRALAAQAAADRLEPDAERGSDAWRAWRESEQWQEWNQTVAPAVAARRRLLKLLGDKQAVRILIEDIASHMQERNGGYTRVLRLATPRLGDAGPRAILELVGTHDRQRRQPVRPAFEEDLSEGPAPDEPPDEPEAAADQPADEAPPEQPPEDE